MVYLVPGQAVRVEPGLEGHGQVHEVAEVQHEVLELLLRVLKVSTI